MLVITIALMTKKFHNVFMEPKKYKIIIFKCTFPDEKIYIGKTLGTIESLVRDAILHPSNKTLFDYMLSKTIKKDLKFEILAVAETHKEANSICKKYVNQFNSANRSFGYNYAYSGRALNGINWAEKESAIELAACSRLITRFKKSLNNDKIKNEKLILRISNIIKDIEKYSNEIKTKREIEKRKKNNFEIKNSRKLFLEKRRLMLEQSKKGIPADFPVVELEQEFVEFEKERKKKSKEIKLRHRKENPHIYRASTAKRRAIKLRATPKWLTSIEKEEIKKIYKNCPEGYEVDHIIPLKGKNVCGLHVPWNLQYLTVSENRSKNNKIKDSKQ